MGRPSEPGAMFETFVAQVQDRAGLGNPQEADQVARATLAALAEAVSAGQLEDLSHGLPPQLTAELHAPKGQAKSFDKTMFLDQVSADITAVDPDTVEQQARAVLRTVAEWAPPGEVGDVTAQLPGPLADLFS